MLRLTSLSFAHPVVLSDRRARLSLSGPLLDSAHASLRSAGQQAFLLSTCLRVEIAWAAGPESISEILTSVYGDASLSSVGTVRYDEAAFEHLCRIAAGLNSPLLGEPEVLGQFRHAVSVCNQASAGLGSLGRLLDAAIGIGRNTRRLLGDAPRGSLAALAASEVESFGPVAILGAGAMARAAAEHFDGVEVTIFARRPGSVAGHETLAWEAASEALATYPVVISTVPGKIPLFAEDVLSHSFASRRAPLLLIDLGMPPGFTRPEIDLVRYIGIDEVASSAKARASAEAEEHVLMAATAAWRRLAAPDRVGVVIAALLAQAETPVAEEVARFASRLLEAQDSERVLMQLARTVARRVLHPPIAFISSSERGSEAVEVLADAFGVDGG